MPRSRRDAPLEEYNAKRDFGVTPEPAGDVDARPAGERARFVVQEHHARALHWDLRLEHDGVLLSWAVPKGIPSTPKRNHLAVHTEDHPLEYLDFEGDIPDGNYGAGSMHVWDRGEYEIHELRDDKVTVTFFGERVRGRYALFQTDGRNWMIHRMDPPSDPERALVPTDVQPMLATPTATVPTGSGWAWEMKWDGVRCLATVEGGRVRLANRSGGDITRRYPEIRALGESLGSTEVVLDGELVVFDGSRPDFQLMQRRMHVENEREIRRLAAELPAVFVIFDLLWLDGHSTMPLPYTERRRLLLGLELSGPAWQTPPHEVGDGAATIAVTEQFGLEGVVAKRLDSPYEPGRRSRVDEVEAPAAAGVRRGRMDAGNQLAHGADRLVARRLLRRRRRDLALRGPGRNRFHAGRVGPAGRQARAAPARVEPVRGPGKVPKTAVFVEPVLVVEVRFTEWTAGGSVRQPAYLGERTDKPATEVGRELRT